MYRNSRFVLRWSLDLEKSEIPYHLKTELRPSSATSVGLCLKVSKTHQPEAVLFHIIIMFNHQCIEPSNIDSNV